MYTFRSLAIAMIDNICLVACVTDLPHDTLRPKKRDVVLPFATDPKILKSTVCFFFKVFFCYRFVRKESVLKHS